MLRFGSRLHFGVRVLAGTLCWYLVALVLLVVSGCFFVRDLGLVVVVVLGVWWWSATGWVLLFCVCGLYCLQFWGLVFVKAWFWIGGLLLEFLCGFRLIAGFWLFVLFVLVNSPLRSVCLLVGFALAVALWCMIWLLFASLLVVTLIVLLLILLHLDRLLGVIWFSLLDFGVLFVWCSLVFLFGWGTLDCGVGVV